MAIPIHGHNVCALSCCTPEPYTPFSPTMGRPFFAGKSFAGSSVLGPRRFLSTWASGMSTAASRVWQMRAERIGGDAGAFVMMPWHGGPEDSYYYYLVLNCTTRSFVLSPQLKGYTRTRFDSLARELS